MWMLVLPLALLLLLWFLDSRKAKTKGEATLPKTVASRPQKVPSAQQIYKIKRVTNLFVASSQCVTPAKTGIEIDWVDGEVSSSSTPAASAVPVSPVQQPLPQADSPAERTAEMNTELTNIIQQLNNRLKAMDQRDRKEKVERQEITSIIQTLQTQLQAGEEKLASMAKEYENKKVSMSEQHEKEIKEEHDKVTTFVFKLEQRDQQLTDNVVDQMEDGRLREVAQQLVQDYNVRLLAVDCGLNFVLDTPQHCRAVMEERGLEIGEVLKTLLPEAVRSGIRLGPPTPIALREHPRRRQVRRSLRIPIQACDAEEGGDVVSDSGPPGDRPTPGSEPGSRIGTPQDEWTPSSSDDSVFPDSPVEASVRQGVGGSRPSSSVSDRHTSRQGLSTASEKSPYRSAKDLEIEWLKARVKQLEQEREGDRTPDRARVRPENERLLTVSFNFRPKRPHLSSPFQALAATDRGKVLEVSSCLQRDHRVSLLGVFWSCCSETDGLGDGSLAFHLQTSLAELQQVKDQQQNIQILLSALLADRDVVWNEPTTGRYPTSPTKEL